MPFFFRPRVSKSMWRLKRKRAVRSKRSNTIPQMFATYVLLRVSCIFFANVVFKIYPIFIYFLSLVTIFFELIFHQDHETARLILSCFAVTRLLVVPSRFVRATSLQGWEFTKSRSPGGERSGAATFSSKVKGHFFFFVARIESSEVARSWKRDFWTLVGRCLISENVY